MSKKSSNKPPVNYYQEIKKKLKKFDYGGYESLLYDMINAAPGGKDSLESYSDISDAIETKGISKEEYEKFEGVLQDLLDRRGEAGFNLGYALGKFGLDALIDPGQKVRRVQGGVVSG